MISGYGISTTDIFSRRVVSMNASIWEITYCKKPKTNLILQFFLLYFFSFTLIFQIDIFLNTLI